MLMSVSPLYQYKMLSDTQGLNRQDHRFGALPPHPASFLPSLGGYVDVTPNRACPFAWGAGAVLTQSLWFGSLSLFEKKLQDQCAVAGGVGSQLGSKGAWGEKHP